MADKVRLEGVINHVLRRRIMRTEKQLIPRGLRGDGQAGGGRGDAAESPAAPESTPFAIPAAPSSFLPLHGQHGFAHAGWQMPAMPAVSMLPMAVMPVVAGWVFHPGAAAAIVAAQGHGCPVAAPAGAATHMHGWPATGWPAVPGLSAAGAAGAAGADAAHAGMQKMGDASAYAPPSNPGGAAAEAAPVFILRSSSDVPGSGCAGRAPSLATRCPSTATRCSSTAAAGTSAGVLAEAAELAASATKKRKAERLAGAADGDLQEPLAKSPKKKETTALSTVEQALLVLQAHEDELKLKQSKIQEIEDKENDTSDDAVVSSEQADLSWWGAEFTRTTSIHRTSSSAGVSTSELLRNASPFIRNFGRTSSTASRIDGFPSSTGLARTSSSGHVLARTSSSGFVRTSSSAFARTSSSGFSRTLSSGFGRTSSSGFARTSSSGFGRTSSSAFGRTGSLTTNAFARTSSSGFATPFGRTKSGAAAGSGCITPANAAVSGAATPKEEYGRSVSGLVRTASSCAQATGACAQPTGAGGAAALS